MRLWIGSGVFAVMMGIAACGQSKQQLAPPAGSDAAAAVDSSAAAEPESAGRALYRQACVMCHGEHGAGTQLGSALSDHPRDVEAVIAAVRDGVPNPKEDRPPMPARGDGTWTDAQVRTVAEYVHGLAK